MKLPEEFLIRMKTLLGAEFEAYLNEMERPALRGVRLNPLKCDLETLKRSVPYCLTPAPFSPFCFYAQGDARPGQLPAHHAGMFYSQEPSAASAVTALAPQPGERVLDLCAAPGGKSTQIAGLLQGEGLLWSNEIVKSRAAALAFNLERMGARNVVVSSCHPQRLCESLAGFFDRVLVDAPCSGEGMFRRDPEAAAQWTPESPRACAARQLAILDSAALAVRPGGVLVYSTCTFSMEENEEVVSAFLETHREFAPVNIDEPFGRPAFHGAPGRRIFPMDGGEGHFVAKLCKLKTAQDKGLDHGTECLQITKQELSAARALYEELFYDTLPSSLVRYGDRLFLLPEGLPRLTGLGVLRAGVELGTLRGGRVEPAHGLFMSKRKSDCRRAIDFAPEVPELLSFLRGEEIDCGESGYTAVCVNGVVTGFGKASGGRLKNRYPKGLRVLGNR